MSNLNGNRVLGRMGARELDFEESKIVNGGAMTATLCTVGPPKDGDVRLGECGH